MRARRARCAVGRCTGDAPRARRLLGADRAGTSALAGRGALSARSEGKRPGRASLLACGLDLASADAQDILLRGLDGSNPLGFLAALGTLHVLDDAGAGRAASDGGTSTVAGNP